MNKLNIDLFQLLSALSTALDFCGSGVMRHHMRVALIAKQIAEEIGMAPDEIRDVVYASIVHDIGAVTWQDKKQLHNFEIQNPHQHSQRGATLLENSPLFSHLTDVIFCHHCRWDGNKADLRGTEIPLISRIIHVSDRVDVLINEEQYILHQREDIINKIKSGAGKVFDPQLVDVLASIAQRESFWLDLTAKQMEEFLLAGMQKYKKDINLTELLSVGDVFAQVIDGKSPFTHNHSRMVSAVAAHMGQLAGYSDEKCQTMRVAGLLHDLGKMAVPEAILEKPGRLSPAEYNIIKSHTYYTYRILEQVEGLEEINQWGSYHHECLNGNGYPFRKQANELSDEARIMAVCDIFTALVENRPYRAGLPRAKVEEILLQKVEKNDIDEKWVYLLLENYHQLEVYKELE